MHLQVRSACVILSSAGMPLASCHYSKASSRFLGHKSIIIRQWTQPTPCIPLFTLTLPECWKFHLTLHQKPTYPLTSKHLHGNTSFFKAYTSCQTVFVCIAAATWGPGSVARMCECRRRGIAHLLVNGYRLGSSTYG